MLGFKDLAWQSVEQPPILPKPHLTPLTGGYRRIPVLQDGADLWVRHAPDRARAGAPRALADAVPGCNAWCRRRHRWWPSSSSCGRWHCSCQASMRPYAARPA